MIESKFPQVTAVLIAFSFEMSAVHVFQARADDAPQSGLPQRVPWTTSRISGSPEPPLPYVDRRVFPLLKFNQCLDITAAPGSDRLFVVEQAGKIYSFPNRQDVEEADLVADLAAAIEGVHQVYALAFHPNFEQNGYCYVCYIKEPNLEDGTHIARFRLADSDPPTLDISSECTIITWFSGGHNGCCLKFGPDGYLYVSTGDGGPANPPDPKQAGQDISNLLSCILRLDVDQAVAGKNYRIPPDNPFVGMDDARGEIWAYGFRNPWRMSFDRKTGDLWVGDVGWELWELLDRVERGGNYGWAVREGRHLVHAEWPRGPTPILPPTIDHPHSESSSITDGLTYYGNRLPELYGMHIYGDYDTGKFWGFRYEQGQVVDHQELADTTMRVVGFGADNRGEFYVLDHTAGTIHRLVPNPERGQDSTFPRRLSESGLFSSVSSLAPAPGVIPYSINAEPWEDYAAAERLVGVPGERSINATGATWSFPQDSVLAKTLSLDLRQGDPASRRHIETQILYFDGLEWYPYTYRWNDEQTDAFLVGPGGDEATFEIEDAQAAGGKRKQTWRFSGRAECQRCHNKWSGPPLGFNTVQLNRDHQYGARIASQLDTFAHIRLFEKPVPSEERQKLADPRDSRADLDARARAYLQVNCAHCHRLHAGSSVLSKMHYDLPLEQTNMVGVRPTQGTFGIHAAQVIAPGDPFRSILLYRLAKLGGGRMPRIGSTEIDLAGVKLLHDWVAQLPPQSSQQEPPGGETVRQLRQGETKTLRQLRQAQSTQIASDLINRLLSTTSGALMLLRSLDDQQLPTGAASLAIQRGSRHEDVQVRDLFERFLPADQRTQRLGTVVEPAQILSLDSDPARGKRVFFETAGVQCKNCHRIQQEGTELGPELTTIGKKYNRAQLLESILEPSKLIEPKYVTYLAETEDGRLLTGLLVERGEDDIVLRDAQNKLLRIPAKQVEQLVPQPGSLMPELLLRDMTAQQVADLLAYLSSLK